MSLQGPLTQPYYEYFGPEYQLNLRTTRQMANDNVQADIDRIKAQVLENLRQLGTAPGALRGFRVLVICCFRALGLLADMDRIMAHVLEDKRQLGTAPGVHPAGHVCCSNG